MAEGELAFSEGQIIQGLEGEQKIIERELTFFDLLGPPFYVGRLTNTPVGVLKQNYPYLLGGIQQLYEHLSKAAGQDFTHGMLGKHLYMQAYQGNLLTNEEVEEVRRRIADSDYSLHVQAYLAYTGGLVTRRRREDRRERQLEFGDITNDGDIHSNKAVCLSHILQIPAHLDFLYGEVDYRSALVTEALLHAPFLLTVLEGQAVEESALRQSGVYN